jgi:hypothetical protein
MIMLALTEAAHTAGVVRCEQARASEAANLLDLSQQKSATRNASLMPV